MEFRILGPLEALDDGVPVALGGGKQQALLADLLLSANRVVAVERLMDDLWGEGVPESARKMVQIHVSQLRKVLPDRLRTRAPGYVIEVRDEELDLRRFEHLVAEGRAALAGGDPDAGSALLTEALALWRGPALAEFDEPFARPEGSRLEELRLSALEERIEADLSRGLHGSLVAELETLAARQPLRERLRRQLMLALYCSGRPAEALESYRVYRRTLDDDLGLDPSPELKELERRMLHQDPELRPPPPPAQSPVHRVPATVVDARPPLPSTEVRYARSGDVSIAYQVAGDGPFDLVVVPGYVSHVELGWVTHPFGPILRRFASFSRLTVFDKRGTGMSDRVADVASLEIRMDDVRAVMDAAAVARAAIMGISEGAPMSLLFAATYPERVTALVLLGGYARTLWAPDYQWGFTDDQDRLFREGLQRLFGSREDAIEAMRWFGRYTDDELGRFVDFNRRAASPGAWEALNAMNREIDVRHVLPAIHVPTLIVHGSDDPPIPVGAARYMAERIPGARLVELPGELHFPAGEAIERSLDEIQRFLQDVWEEGGWEEPERDRVLATVLFTDIVGSSERAAALGDRAWSDLLERHHALVRRQLLRFRGREVDTAGDGFLAVFDGPARAIRCARSIVKEVRALGLEVRSGLHTGECEVVDGKVAGIAVHTGARVAALARPSEVLVTQTVKDLVAGSGLAFEDQGVETLSGVPGEWRLYAVSLTETPAS